MVLLPFDLHVLGTPPALILSQDQTLQKIYLLFCFFSFLLLFFFRIALLFASSFFISSYTVFKDLNSIRVFTRDLYIITSQSCCQLKNVNI